jgi:hypothetical protein
VLRVKIKYQFEEATIEGKHTLYQLVIDSSAISRPSQFPLTTPRRAKTNKKRENNGLFHVSRSQKRAPIENIFAQVFTNAART